MSYTFRGMEIPDYMLDSLKRWVQDGITPGDFLDAILCNDLSRAVAHADDDNIHLIGAYVGWPYNEAPGGCWGSELAVRHYREHKLEAALRQIAEECPVSITHVWMGTAEVPPVFQQMYDDLAGGDRDE